jgi:hypothetical protein
MAEFEELRANFSKLDREADAARRAARTAYMRAISDKDDRELAEQARAAKKRADALQGARGVAQAAFADFSDPRKGVTLLSDDTPILLLPLRLETRFKSVQDPRGEGTRPELWLRIYPDECSIDAFDPELSTTEIDAGLRFWREYWRAAGNDAESRAAWRNLVGTYGVGRSSWIVKAFAPVTPGDRPIKLPETDLVLVIAGADLPPAPQRTPLGAFWSAVWKAQADAAAQGAASAALATAIGDPAAAEDLAARFVPFNLTDAPPPGRMHETTNVIVAWLDLPAMEGEDRPGWRRAPMGAALPERFVVLGFTGETVSMQAMGAPIAEPLYVGPDPAAPEGERIVPKDGKLEIPELLKWLFDFDEALKAGMALRILLTQDQAARGFDRILVLGIRMRANGGDGRAAFEELIAGHAYSRAGFELLPQGSATNNADDQPSAWSRRDDPDLSYDDVFGPPKFEVKSDPLEKRDGQVLAEQLGLDPAKLLHTRGADGRDTLEAQAMNLALAPGTLGYITGSLMNPVFEGWIDELTWYFTSYVSARGGVPAIRIGAQPYGIIATTAFSRMSWLDRERPQIFATHWLRPDRQWRMLQMVHRMLGLLEGSWRSLVGELSRVGGGGDPHKALLDILGLHPNSAEFHTRQGKSLDELSSRGRLAGFRRGPSERARAAAQRRQALLLLRNLGYDGAEPDILNLFFRGRQIPLLGPLVDVPPLSESVLLPDATTDGRSYLEWLADAARASLDVLRRQDGFVNDAPPRALLYIMLHFALTRGYQDAGDRLRIESGLFTPDMVRAFRREPTSVHLATAAQASDSPWQRLYGTDQRLTGQPNLSIADHITRLLPTRPSYAIDLAEQIRAVELLEQTPTARLERLLIEHIDALTYRFDSWRLGLVRWQLERMRQTSTQGGGAQPKGGGLYLGAYGWLEQVRPKPKPVTAPDLPPVLAEAFKEGPPLQLDRTNGGHLHAPSMNQAVSAAILRAGELANRLSSAPNAYSINLASERVRKAAALLEGVRTGQNLGALLGYRFERALHDYGGVLELDALIFAFRRAFPLVSQRLRLTQNPAPPADEPTEARNVVDGLALVKRASTAGNTTYPYGKDLPGGLSAAERAAIEKAVADLKDVFDAMSDLILAEGMHQAAQGNPDRVAAHLEVQADFNPPPNPAVVQTPNRGFALTCRVGLELDPAAAAATNDPPRAKAQPALNAWLGDAMPALGDIACTATWKIAGGAEQSQIVTLAELDLAPIDVINLISDEGGAGLAELDDRVRRRIFLTANPRSDAQFKILYMAADPDQTSVFVASALVKRLRGLALRSRPLRASDVALPGKAEKSAAVDHVAARERIADVVDDLTDLRAALDTDIAAVALLIGDPNANRAALLDDIDDRIAAVIERLHEAAAFGGAKVGWGGIYDWRSERFSALLKRIKDLLERWEERLAACEQALADELALPGTATPEERVNLLRAAEGQVSTALDANTDPGPLRTAVEAKRTAFMTKRDAIRATALDAPDPGLADRLARCVGVLPIEAFDPEPLSFADIEDSIISYWSDQQALLVAARKDADQRIIAATAALADHDAALDAAGRLKAMQAGAQAIFGEGFTLIPTFTLPADAGAEQTQAHAHFTAGTLLAHARAAIDDENALDTWFYGAARVRPKLKQLEDAIMLWEAQGLETGALNALQLPHKAGAPWMALDFPKEHAPTSEHLAYVAFAGPGYNPAAARCGLLLDDWSETVPAVEADEPGPQHTTGVAFHFDRPSQEPPQAMLLLAPAQWDGRWSWDDVVQGVIDTFDLARMRAVEPDRLDDGALAQYLPATVASVTTSGLSLSANFAMLNMDIRFVRDT